MKQKVEGSGANSSHLLSFSFTVRHSSLGKCCRQRSLINSTGWAHRWFASPFPLMPPPLSSSLVLPLLQPPFPSFPPSLAPFFPLSNIHIHFKYISLTNPPLPLGTMGFLISTIGIVIFGEICPQVSCFFPVAPSYDLKLFYLAPGYVFSLTTLAVNPSDSSL